MTINTTVETYKSITSFPRYEVSNFGNARRRLISGGYLQLKPWLSGSHYVIGLYDGAGERRDVRLHRLVLELFVGPAPEDAPLGLHIDDDPSNNHISNLMWGDKRLNARHMITNGRQCPANEKTFLDRVAARDIKTIYSHGHLSMTKLAEAYDCSRWTVSNIINDRIQRLN